MTTVSYDDIKKAFVITGFHETDEQPVFVPVEHLYPGCCCFGLRHDGGWDMHDNDACGDIESEYLCCFDVDDDDVVNKFASSRRPHF